MVYYYNLGKTLLMVEDKRTQHLISMIEKSPDILDREIEETVKVKVIGQIGGNYSQRKIHRDLNGEYFFWKNQKVYRDNYVKHSLAEALRRVNDFYANGGPELSKELTEDVYGELLRAIIYEGIQSLIVTSKDGNWRIHPASIVRYDGRRIMIQKFGTEQSEPATVTLTKRNFLDKVAKGNLIIQKSNTKDNGDHTQEFWATAKRSLEIWKGELKKAMSGDEDSISKLVYAAYKREKNNNTKKSDRGQAI